MSDSNSDEPKRYPGRLEHRIPHWVDRRNTVYHIRIRCEKSNPQPLTDPSVAESLLNSVHLYSDLGRWWARVFLLMPDHLHALLSFDPKRRLSRIVGDSKKWHQLNTGIVWQENFFDHRIRHDESLDEKTLYIRLNPVKLCLCEKTEDWKWWTGSDGHLRYPRGGSAAPPGDFGEETSLE